MSKNYKNKRPGHWRKLVVVALISVGISISVHLEVQWPKVQTAVTIQR